MNAGMNTQPYKTKLTVHVQPKHIKEWVFR